MEASSSQRFINLISEILRISPQDVVDTIGMDDVSTWDSLSHMQLIVTIESDFGIELSAEEIVDMRTVGKIRELLHSKGIEA